MSPVLLTILVLSGLWLAMQIDRRIRSFRRKRALSHRQWCEYAEMAARNAERWRHRV
ncbi:MAG: hypothetical protein SFU56_02675 [Capsulimonadales bacterium]|nr:hypothetical protein [Capsulimonadales bacterium]